MESPIRNAMSTSQRSLLGSSATFSHLSIAQKTAAVNKDDNAYTSPSSAENPAESVNAYESAPTAPATRIKMNVSFVNSSCTRSTNFFARCVMLQNKNKAVNALANADMVLMQAATCSRFPKSEKNLATSKKNGAPGGCPVSIPYEHAMYSPQSQKLAVGSMVRQ